MMDIQSISGVGTPNGYPLGYTRHSHGTYPTNNQRVLGRV